MAFYKISALLEAELMSTYFGSAMILGRNPTHLQQKFIYFIFSYTTQKILSLSRKKRAAFQNAKKVGSRAGVLFFGGNVCHLQRAGWSG
jgi:hypothetical protein